MIRLLSPRGWLLMIYGALVIAALLVLLSWCSRGDRIRSQKLEAQTANATGAALDKVATETPIIRQEQQEKQREVDNIQGADERLPDGFGAELERVRRGRERQHP